HYSTSSLTPFPTRRSSDLYDGTNPDLPIYLAINGTIFDVSASRHIYGPGGSYHFFAGHDATRAYVTGCFTEDITPDLRGVEEMLDRKSTRLNSSHLGISYA